jgi:hypothetical protein
MLWEKGEDIHNKNYWDWHPFIIQMMKQMPSRSLSNYSCAPTTAARIVRTNYSCLHYMWTETDVSMFVFNKPKRWKCSDERQSNSKARKCQENDNQRSYPHDPFLRWFDLMANLSYKFIGHRSIKNTKTLLFLCDLGKFTRMAFTNVTKVCT